MELGNKTHRLLLYQMKCSGSWTKWRVIY